MFQSANPPFANDKKLTPRAGKTGKLKSDFEVFILRVGRDFFDSGFSGISAKFFFYIPHAIVDCLSRTLDEHLNGTIR
jgi:hypothetical protein